MKRDAPLLADVRECPASWALAASWAVVFAAMHLVQWQGGIAMPDGGLANPLAVSSQVGHRFGDMTWAEVRHGEAWRLITATFIHFSLVHVGMNAFGLIKLGQLIEPWYGPGPFLAVCVAIGGLGNLVGGLIRQGIALARVGLAGTRLAQAWPSWFEVEAVDGVARSFLIPSGGGSTILLGLLGLGAVVGWRSKTRIGSFLRDQMVVMLAFTAILGFLLINLIDNYGHAGGAIVGAGFGFAHRPLLRLAERSRAFRLACGAGALAVVVGAALAAGRDDRHEAGLRREYAEATAQQQGDQLALGNLERLSVAYGRVVGLGLEGDGSIPELDRIALDPDPLLRAIATAASPPAAPGPPRPVRARARSDLRIALNALNSRWAGTWGDEVAADLTEVKILAQAAIDRDPDYPQVFAFTVAWRSAIRAIRRDHDRAAARQAQIQRQFQQQYQ